MTHICVNNLTIINRRQVIIWTNAGILIGPLRKEFGEILIEIYFHSRKRIWKCRLENSGQFVSASMCWQSLLYKLFDVLVQLCWHLMRIPYWSQYICWAVLIMLKAVTINLVKSANAGILGNYKVRQARLASVTCQTQQDKIMLCHHLHNIALVCT